MAGVVADQGQVGTPDSSPPPTAGRFQVVPETVLDLAEAFRNAADTLEVAWRGVGIQKIIPADAFLGDPYSKWAVRALYEYFFAGPDSFANALEQLIIELKRTFNALRAAAEEYGKTDEWNARNLGEPYGLS